MSSDIDCFFFPELTFRSWFLLFCSVFKDLFFAPFRVPDYITTTWWSLQAFFSSSFFISSALPWRPFILANIPLLCQTLFSLFYIFYKTKKRRPFWIYYCSSCRLFSYNQNDPSYAFSPIHYTNWLKSFWYIDFSML